MSYLTLAKKIEQELAGNAARRIELPEALQMLSGMHTEIRSMAYEAGALSWALSLPDLRRQFEATERAIDQLAAAGPTEGAFREAIAAHTKVWFEIVARYHAHRERQ